jgi:hypothetical protein
VGEKKKEKRKGGLGFVGDQKEKKLGAFCSWDEKAGGGGEKRRES